MSDFHWCCAVYLIDSISMQTRDRQCFKVSSLACWQVANVSATNIVNENNVETSLIEFQGEPCKTPTVELIPPIFHNPFTFTFMVRRCTSKPLTPPLVLGKHAKMFPKKIDQNNSSHDEQRGFVGIIISTFPNFIWSIKKFQFLFTSLLLVPRPTYAVAPVKTPISDSEFTTLHFLGAGFRPSARIGDCENRFAIRICDLALFWSGDSWMLECCIPTK